MKIGRKLALLICVLTVLSFAFSTVNANVLSSQIDKTTMMTKKVKKKIPKKKDKPSKIGKIDKSTMIAKKVKKKIPKKKDKIKG